MALLRPSLRHLLWKAKVEPALLALPLAFFRDIMVLLAFTLYTLSAVCLNCLLNKDQSGDTYYSSSSPLS
eukprot:scaffold8284_cov265-Skeletonema_marinoi.AAC.1